MELHLYAGTPRGSRRMPCLNTSDDMRCQQRIAFWDLLTWRKSVLSKHAQLFQPQEHISKGSIPCCQIACKSNIDMPGMKDPAKCQLHCFCRLSECTESMQGTHTLMRSHSCAMKSALYQHNTAPQYMCLPECHTGLYCKVPYLKALAVQHAALACAAACVK